MSCRQRCRSREAARRPSRHGPDNTPSTHLCDLRLDQYALAIDAAEKICIQVCRSWCHRDERRLGRCCGGGCIDGGGGGTAAAVVAAAGPGRLQAMERQHDRSLRIVHDTWGHRAAPGESRVRAPNSRERAWGLAPAAGPSAGAGGEPKSAYRSSASIRERGWRRWGPKLVLLLPVECSGLTEMERGEICKE